MLVNLIVTYIWIGSAVPEDYMIRLSKENYPIQIILNPPLDRPNLPFVIQKADYYRLQYLQKGGIYSDFDNILNYTRLMQKINEFDGEMLTFDYGGPQWATSINNGFIYVPANRTDLVKQMVRENKQKTCKDVTNCFGPQFLFQYSDRITKWSMYDCVSHQFDFGWSDESNSIRHTKTKASLNFRTYKVSKFELIQKIQYMVYLRYSLIFGIIFLGIWFGILITKNTKK